jgi:hypothetical protein
MRKKLVIPAALAAAALTLTGCSDDSSGSSHAEHSHSAEPSESPSGAASSPSAKAEGTSIDITIKDGKVTPNGDRVKAKVGEPVTLHIDADEPGEIHVHSTPEQEIEFDEGTSTKRLTIKAPGIVDVEDHKLEQVIVQLQVS